MKFLVINSSGNVGKTTFTREGLYPFLENPKKVIEIETVNASSEAFEGMNVVKYPNFTEFEPIYLEMLSEENTIFDVGASVLTNFFSEMMNYAGILEVIDKFIIPARAGDKITTDTIRTISLLTEQLGIPVEKIAVVLNGSKIEDFTALRSTLDKMGINSTLHVPETPIFNELGTRRKTIEDIIQYDTSYYTELVKKSEPAQKITYVKLDLLNRKAITVREILQDIFNQITGLEIQKEEEPKPKKEPKAKPKPKVEDDGTNEDDEEL